jgi:peptidoglycan/xylan/chitin deacetylase (PgdA/CDA1 family)
MIPAVVALTASTLVVLGGCGASPTAQPVGTSPLSPPTGSVTESASPSLSVTSSSPSPTPGSTLVYLTFDDGPASGSTSKFLDLLEQEHVRATFFVTGVAVNPETDADIKREQADGDHIGLHTYTHDYAKVYASDAAYWADLDKIAQRVQGLTGLTPKMVRLPGGASNTVSRQYSKGIMTRVTQELDAKGYHYFDWNVSSGDGGSNTDPAYLTANLENGTRPGRENIVLSHDTKLTTLPAIKNYIEWCKQRGYVFMLVDMSTPVVHQPVAN